MIKKALLVSMVALLPTSSILAESYYRVSGNSMYPTLQENSILEVEEKEDIEDGSIVVARTEDGTEIVKRLEGEQLVGDNKENSLSFKKDNVTILGEAKEVEANNEIEEDNLKSVFATGASYKTKDGEIITSPIDKTFSGNNYTIFIHEDGTLSGFGDNYGCKFNYSPCSDKTASLVEILKGPTGVTHIDGGWMYASAYIPHPDEPNLYTWIRLDNNIDTDQFTYEFDRTKADYVRYSERAGHDNYHYYRWYSVLPDGSLDVQGSDYVENLGTGRHDPSGEHFYMWYDNRGGRDSWTHRPFVKEVLAPKPDYERSILVEGDGSFDNVPDSNTNFTVEEYGIFRYSGGHADSHEEFLTMTDTTTPNIVYRGKKPWVNREINGYYHGQVSDDSRGYTNGSNYWDYFVHVWSGTFYAPETGTYTFAVDGDNAVEVEVNGTVVRGWYGGHGRCDCTDYSGTIELTAGYHQLTFRQQEWTGSSYAHLHWKKPSDTEFSPMPLVDYDYGTADTPVVYTTNPFTINNPDDATQDWEMRFDMHLGPEGDWEYEGTKMDIRVLKDDGTGNFVEEYAETWIQRTDWHETSKRAIPMPDNGTYKVEVTSSNIGWELFIQDRHYFEHYHKIARAHAAGYYGRTTLVTEEGRIFKHSEYWDQFVELNVDDGSGVSVELIPETIEEGYYVTVALDTQGRAWYWDYYNTAYMFNFPDIDDAPFYDNYKVVKVDAGARNFVFKVESKNTGKTYVWTGGENHYGELGLGNHGEQTTEMLCVEKESCTTTLDQTITLWEGGWTNRPLLLHRDGVPLTNIRDVSAGSGFTVVVQDSPKGQLVWAFGSNGEGRLGGGMELYQTTPITIPGLKDIVDIAAEPDGSTRRGVAINNEGSMFYWGYQQPTFTEYNWYDFKNVVGPIKSYSGRHGLHTSSSYRIGYVLDINGTPWSINTHPHYVAASYNGHDYEDRWARVQIDSDYTHLLPPEDVITDDNGTPTDTSDDKYYFKNVQEFHWGYGSGWLLDSQGMLWSFGYTKHANQGHTWTDEWTYSGDESGVSRKVIRYARPALLSGEHPTTTDYAKGFIKMEMEGLQYPYNAALALKSDGTLWTTGYDNSGMWNPQDELDITHGYYVKSYQDYNGRFYDLETSAYIDPINLPKFTDIASEHHGYGAIALDENGRVWTSGLNDEGQLGKGNTSTSYRILYKLNPESYKNPNTGELQKVTKVFANYRDSMFFVTEDGRTWGMGANEYGQLGIGDTVDRNVPTEIPGIINPVKIEGTHYVNYFLMPDGTVKAAGYAALGELGNNFTTEKHFASTAFGNETPILTISDTVGTNYYSRNSIFPEKRKIEINGTIQEHDAETTEIYTSLLGFDLKKDNDSNGKTDELVIEGSSFQKDIFDTVIPQEFKLTFDLVNIEEFQVQQDGMKITANDERGGLTEYAFNSIFIVDDEKPTTPTWGETKVFDRTNNTEQALTGNMSTNLMVYEYDVSGYTGTKNHSTLPVMTDESTTGVELVGSQIHSSDIYGSQPAYFGSQDYFTLKFVGTFYAPEDGVYTFASDSDNNATLEINGNVIVQSSCCTSGYASYTGTVELTKGYHNLVYRIWEHTGGAYWRLGWKKPSDTSIQTMPVEYFRNRDPVRLYVDVPQKNGDSKAPVYFQYQYRKKYNFGYLNEWSEWETIKNKNYVEFFQGFDGETQVKVRAIDAAGNISNEQAETRYFGIADAGGKVTSLSIQPKIEGNTLKNVLKIKGYSFDTPMEDIGIERRLVTDDNIEHDWEVVTPERVAWVGTNEDEQIVEDVVLGLLGNSTYEYRVTLKNGNAVGPEKIGKVKTMPYNPKNFAKNPHSTGMLVGVVQDKRNVGTIDYRLVLIDNLTGTVWSHDTTSSNKNEDLIYDIVESAIFKEKEEQLTVEDFNIVNNSIQIKLLVRGENGKWNDIVYDTNFVNSPAVSSDTAKPETTLSIFGGKTTELDDGTTNPIDLTLFATDNQSPPERLQYSLSLNGEEWYGKDGEGKWILNLWAPYTSKITNFPLGTGVGKRQIYVRVRDEAGNISYTTTNFEIIEPIERTINETTGEGTVRDNSGSITTQDNDFTVTEELHTRSSNVQLNIPKTGNETEVQFSFDGIDWSPWEPINETFDKFVSFRVGGAQAIYVRYRNEYGSMSPINPDSDIVKYMFDNEKPEGIIETKNGTYITDTLGIRINFLMDDNLSNETKIILEDPTGVYKLHEVYSDGTINTTPYVDNTIVVPNQTKTSFEVLGLNEVGFHEIPFKFIDKAGNERLETIRIYRK